MPDPLVLVLDDPAATLAVAGGKGASLARLAGAGLPVPPGFHVTTEAYRRFVADIQDQITTSDARRIEDLLSRQEIPPMVAEAVIKAYADLGGPHVAVRSSATAEDLPGMSFAGQQDSLLNVHGETDLLRAVKNCWASLWTERAMDYRAQRGIKAKDVALAVVVQQLVPADAAGVLFTADPVTGSRDRMLINASWGLGEAVVGGQVTPDTIVLDHGQIIEHQVATKTVMTVCTADRTTDVPVPDELRDKAVLTDGQVCELARIGARIQQLYGTPMDVEWARRDDRVFVLQARPITGSNVAQECNDSLSGDFLWINGNVGEAVPDVMTPCSWSLARILFENTMATSSIPGFPGYGNIGGRFYLNYSMAMALARAIGIGRKKFIALTEPVFGALPHGVRIPTLSLPRWKVLRTLLPVTIAVARRVGANAKALPAFMQQAPAHCAKLLDQIETADTDALIQLWDNEIRPHFALTSQMLEAATRKHGSALLSTQRELSKLVGESEAYLLNSALPADGSPLASLGPLLGLAQVARGDIDRETYLRQFGHRSTHEYELSAPRPAEDPQWIENQLAMLQHDPNELLSRQQSARDQAWNRFTQKYPKKVATFRRKVARSAHVAFTRERARSEVARVYQVLRAFVLRAGAVTGHGDALFFLSIKEILAALRNDHSALAKVPARRAAYERYASLPAYPPVIVGRFDPVRWAADPHRRDDLYNDGDNPPASETISGFAGAPGIIEGRARVIRSVEEGHLLRDNEILVTTVTNIGWTPLFPRAAAIVTDVGAPLSHAAIVARELGIPTVVGCGNATSRLRTGDRIRVDGGQGTVEVLEQ